MEPRINVRWSKATRHPPPKLWWWWGPIRRSKAKALYEIEQRAQRFATEAGVMRALCHPEAQNFVLVVSDGVERGNKGRLIAHSDDEDQQVRFLRDSAEGLREAADALADRRKRRLFDG